MIKKILHRLNPNKNHNKIFFLHVPKCGGTSLENAIINSYISLDYRHDRKLIREDSINSAKTGALLYNYDYLHGDVNDYEILKFREFYLAYLMYRQKFFIRGHFTFSQKIYNEFKNDYCFITILRDPVKKWLSNYYYRKNRGSGHWKIDLSLKEYIDSELALVHGYDYSKYFGGKRKDNNYDDVGHIERAKKALENFKIIGFLEHLDDFQNMLNEKFNYNFKIPHKNISKNQEVEVPLELKKKIEKICKVDIEIYDFAIKRFRKQK